MAVLSPGHEDDGVPSGYVASLFDVSGRVAAVTGGGSGLGAAMAIGYADAGATVWVLDIDLPAADAVRDEIESRGGRARAARVDVTSKPDVDRVTREIIGADRQVDVLINSAGTAYRCAAEDFPEDRYDAIIALNLKGTYLTCQSFGRQMLDAGHGSIINILSIGAFVAYPMASAYQASKGGVLQLTRALALEWHPRGVRVNGIAPTLMQSPLTRRVEAATSVTSEFIESRMLQRRLGLPRELIGAAIFLGSEASSIVTGHTLMCDDGYTIA
jgi:NAD(P)-dependent dehydrogenase (short-subunit alcohol dehydrogenase family)